MVKGGVIPLIVKCLEGNQKQLIKQVLELTCTIIQGNNRYQNDFRKANMIPQLVPHLSKNDYVSKHGKSVENLDSVRISTLYTLILLSTNNCKY